MFPVPEWIMRINSCRQEVHPKIQVPDCRTLISEHQILLIKPTHAALHTSAICTVQVFHWGASLKVSESQGTACLHRTGSHCRGKALCYYKASSCSSRPISPALWRSPSYAFLYHKSPRMHMSVLQHFIFPNPHPKSPVVIAATWYFNEGICSQPKKAFCRASASMNALQVGQLRPK